MEFPQELVTGHAEVDAQHLRILEELERIRAAGPSSIAVLVAFLRQHMRSHFAYEELLMDHMDYPYAELHKAEHREYASTVARLQERFDRNRATPEKLAAIVAAVDGWLAEHVTRADQRLAEFIRVRRAGAKATARSVGAVARTAVDSVHSPRVAETVERLPARDESASWPVSRRRA
jgi:hemerythrin